MLALFAIAWFVLTQTAWGKHVYALGDAPEATRLAGVNASRLLPMVYIVAGVIYGVAALLLIGRTASATRTPAWPRTSTRSPRW